MKTPQEILKSHTKGMISEMRIINAMNEYAIEVAREAFKNASEKVKMKEGDRRPSLGSFDYVGTHYTVVDKQSILNENNITKL